MASRTLSFSLSLSFSRSLFISPFQPEAQALTSNSYSTNSAIGWIYTFLSLSLSVIPAWNSKIKLCPNSHRWSKIWFVCVFWYAVWTGLEDFKSCAQCKSGQVHSCEFHHCLWARSRSQANIKGAIRLSWQLITQRGLLRWQEQCEKRLLLA